MKKGLRVVFALLCMLVMLTAVQAQAAQQSEEEFQKLMPVTGTVHTFFGDFQLNHSFPAVGEADKIYDLMDHQRAAQLNARLEGYYNIEHPDAGPDWVWGFTIQFLFPK